MMDSLLVIGFVWPEPSSSAAGARMLQLLEYFTTRGYSITFATTAVKSPYAEDLEKAGIATAKIELNNSSFDLFIKDLNPDVVLFDRFMMEEQFGWRVSENCPSAIKILDTEDLHFLRKYREQQQNLKANETSFKNTDIAKREIASIYRCDLSLIISEAEIELLHNDFQIPNYLLLYLPFLLNSITSKETSKLPSFDDRKNFVSIGNFLHPPNVDAVKYLKDEIWPIIRREILEAEIHIYGAYPTPKIEKLHDPKTGFLIKGRAENAAEVVQNSRVSLAALRFGAGLKGKIIEAMQNGTPFVTTPIGIEGITGDESMNSTVRDNAENFAKEAIELYSSKKKWTAAQHLGFDIINSRFSKEIFYSFLDQALIFLSLNLSDHRDKNFMGSMLNHHHNRSTYYLSKYIEIKNLLQEYKIEEKITPSIMKG